MTKFEKQFIKMIVEARENRDYWEARRDEHPVFYSMACDRWCALFDVIENDKRMSAEYNMAVRIAQEAA